MRSDIKHIIDRLKSECGFENISNEKDSYYQLFTYSNGENIEIRISNHKTDLNTWVTRKYDKGTYPHIRISIVFREDNFENVMMLKKSICKPITIIEYVYDLRDNSIIDDNQISLIRQSIREICNNLQFDDPIGVA